MNERPGSAQPNSDEARASPHALDLDAYIPAYFTYLAGKISASASAIYRPRFGVGITDWRIMALVAAEPWISATRICAETGLDKAAVSRSVHDLAKSGLIEVRPDAADQRRQVIALTRKGIALHDKIVKLAIAREQKLLEGFSASERKTLLGFLIRLQAQVSAANLIDVV
ncbi:MAG: MarR family transcriptional regulator [Rhodoplanes sp.]